MEKIFSQEVSLYFEETVRKEQFSLFERIYHKEHTIPGIDEFDVHFIEKYYSFFDETSKKNLPLTSEKILSSQILSQNEEILKDYTQIWDHIFTAEDIVENEHLPWNGEIISHEVKWDLLSLKRALSIKFNVKKLLKYQVHLSPEDIITSLRDNNISNWDGFRFFDYPQIILALKRRDYSFFKSINNEDFNVFVPLQFILDWVNSPQMRREYCEILSPCGSRTEGARNMWKLDISIFVNRISQYYSTNKAEKTIIFFILDELTESLKAEKIYFSGSISPFIDEEIFLEWLSLFPSPEGEPSPFERYDAENIRSIFCRICHSQSLKTYVEYPFLKRSIWDIIWCIKNIDEFILARNSGLLDITPDDYVDHLFNESVSQKNLIINKIERKAYFILRGYKSAPFKGEIDFSKRNPPRYVSGFSEENTLEDFTLSNEYEKLMKSGFAFENIFKVITNISGFSHEELIENSKFVEWKLILKHPEIKWNYNHIGADRLHLYHFHFDYKKTEESIKILNRTLLKEEWLSIENIFDLFEVNSLPFLVLREIIVEHCRMLYRKIQYF